MPWLEIYKLHTNTPPPPLRRPAPLRGGPVWVIIIRGTFFCIRNALAQLASDRPCGSSQPLPQCLESCYGTDRRWLARRASSRRPNNACAPPLYARRAAVSSHSAFRKSHILQPRVRQHVAERTQVTGSPRIGSHVAFGRRAPMIHAEFTDGQRLLVLGANQTFCLPPT